MSVISSVPECSVDLGKRSLARRYEHNKKREEKDRLEEKYGKPSAEATNGAFNQDEEDSSEDESEDDDADLATKDLDAEIEETLAAIRRKDPKVYNKEVTFYKEFEPDAGQAVGAKKEISMQMLQSSSSLTSLQCQRAFSAPVECPASTESLRSRETDVCMEEY